MSNVNSKNQNEKEELISLVYCNINDSQVEYDLLDFIEKGKFQVVRNIVQFEIDKKLRLRLVGDNGEKLLRFQVTYDGGKLVDSNENEISEYSNVARYEIYDRLQDDYVVEEYVDLKGLKILTNLDNKGWNFTNGYHSNEFDTLEEAKNFLYNDIKEDLEVCYILNNK